MGAHFIGIKQVYGFFLFADMEIPYAIQLSAQTYKNMGQQGKKEMLTYSVQVDRPLREAMYFVDD